MFTTTAAPAPQTVVATVISSNSPAPRPTGVHRGISFFRNLHLHSTSQADPPREDSRLRTRPRASTHTPPASPALASPSQQQQPPLPRLNPLSRRQTSDAHPPAQSSATDSPPDSPHPAMTRTRSETAQPQLQVRNNTGPIPTPPGSANAHSVEGSADGGGAVKHLPSIRFIPHQDPRAGRPSLIFPVINRTLPGEAAILRVGRYSERDNIPEITTNAPSDAPIGFKSKVVSRKHCELWCKDGSWYIKDVKSSSGTFLNHIRLSQPNVESKPFRIKDGDIIQLGIDFRGGEEMIFRCVKIRVECNRGWQQGLNTFNKQTHQRLRALAKSKKEVTGDGASTHTSECAICLMSIAPCQSLFVAPCSHVWHYKCIRPILNGPTWPNFLCPNCRAVADLEEDVDDTAEFDDWEGEEEVVNGDTNTHPDAEQEDRHVAPHASVAAINNSDSDSGGVDLTDLQQQITNIDINDSEPANGDVSHQSAPETPDRCLTPPTSSVTQPVSINVSGANEYHGLSPLYPAAREGLTPDRVQDGPMTPRNDAGPFVLDGSAGRAAGNRLREADLPSDSDSSGEAPRNSEAPTLPPVRFD
ncbi:fha domain-containing protein [Stemphylium lycopersici]|uniref:Fha domain-containing protein n=1 Tax=Stemphylium lycopersici TaxID=183478 RepID=A0A364N2A7_STELY|nr:fha domain-containing protein [Stemphylium lycopersici]RAR01364.1 fha domain-containing protein [Stemphylium lycopersici]RAR09947.1 fha domain-containing protein [Stemphylium lycopersici]